MKLFSTFAAVLFISAGAAAQELSIERLAPRQSVMIVGANNFSATIDRWNNTTLNDVFKLGPFKEMTDEQLDDQPMASDFEEMMDELFEELGINEEPRRIMPTGAAGMAMYLHMDDESGTQRPAMFFFADFGDNAERMQTVLDRMLEKGHEDEHIEFEIDDLMDRKLYNVTMDTGADDAGGDDFDDFDPGMDFPMPLPDFEQMFAGMETMHIVRDGSVFMLSSEVMQLGDALTLIDDKSASEFANSDEVQGLNAQLGTSDMYMMVLIQPVFRMLGSIEPSLGMAEMFFNQMIGNIKALGMNVQFDGPDAMVQGTSVIYMPHGKSGISALMDRSAPRKGMPDFVGPDTVSFSAVNVDMAGLSDFIMTTIRGFPMLQMQFDPQSMQQMEDTVKRLTKALGEEVYMAQTVERPITPEGVGRLVAVKTTNPQELENVLGEFTPQMGMQPRDFLGHRIYAMDPAMAGMMGVPGGGAPAIGVGGGYMFMGMEPAVQQALRAAGQDDLLSLSDNSIYKQAVRVLASDDVIAWGYTDVPSAIEAQLHAQVAAQKQQIDMFREWDPDMAAEMEKEMMDPLKYWDDADWEELRTLLGAQSWEVRSTDVGFVSRFYQFRGVAETTEE